MQEWAEVLETDNDVKIYTGTGEMSIKEAYEAFKNNTLQKF